MITRLRIGENIFSELIPDLSRWTSMNGEYGDEISLNDLSSMIHSLPGLQQHQKAEKRGQWASGIGGGSGRRRKGVGAGELDTIADSGANSCGIICR